MPYHPGLIPKESRVLPDYFTDKPANQRKEPLPPGPTAFAVIFFILALSFIKYPMMGILLAAIGLTCTPVGKRWLQKRFRFTMTPKIRSVFCGILLLPCFPLYTYYLAIDAEDARQSEIRHQQALRFTADSLKKDSTRKDSLHLYMAASKAAEPEQGLLKLKSASRFVVLQSEKDILDTQLTVTTLRYTQVLIRSGRYKQGLRAVQDFLKDHTVTPEFLFNRALCYIKLDSMRLAVDDLDTAMTHGYKPAGKLYNQVNPLRRHIAYYETLCNDGTSSSATGRGACSWHGGVAQWNHPVYQTSRKY
jgi:hypothetical protein